MKQEQQTTQLQPNNLKYQKPTIEVIEMILESTLAASPCGPLDVPGHGGADEL